MEDRKPDGKLRRGWTTGACATAATAAAFRALLSGVFPRRVSIALPRGDTVEFELATCECDEIHATASVIKDAGDDPDVTHGAEITADVCIGTTGSGVTFKAGPGVGTVTLPGLLLGVGEPAINPVPRKMMEIAVREIAAEFDVVGDLEITISVANGEALAKKTMNGRLGIVGGLSILGTTGIVIPFSCSSWIHSIHRGVDVAKAGGITHIAAATGSTSEAAVKLMLGLSEQALIDMGDFAGGLIKYLRKNPIEQLTLAGGFGKLAKLAQGHLDLHSSRSELDLAKLATMAKEAGGDDALVASVKTANTGLQALNLSQSAGIPLADRVALGAREVARAALAGGTNVNVLVFDRQGKLVGRSNDR